MVYYLEHCNICNVLIYVIVPNLLTEFNVYDMNTKHAKLYLNIKHCHMSINLFRNKAENGRLIERKLLLLQIFYAQTLAQAYKCKLYIKTWKFTEIEMLGGFRRAVSPNILGCKDKSNKYFWSIGSCNKTKNRSAWHDINPSSSLKFSNGPD